MATPSACGSLGGVLLVTLAAIACEPAEDDGKLADGGGELGGADASGGSSWVSPGLGGAEAGGATPGLGGSEPVERAGYPGAEWPTGNPADHGVDPAALQAALVAAEAEGSHCLVVVRHGVVLAEGYWNGRGPSSKDKSFSIAKSYTSALVGIAIDRGDIESLDQSASDFLPEWQGTEHEGITIRHLLSMTGGLEWNIFSDYVQMATFSSDHSSFALGLDQAEVPGSKWQYHNGGVQIFEPIFQAATGMTIEAYAAEHLWSVIGSSASWNHDPSEHPTTYAHVMAPCRDHARFGYLYLRGGAWSDGQLIPADHVAASLSPSQEQNRAYGYLFWLNGQTPALDPFNQPKESTIAPFAPADLFAARGFGDQFIDVIPSLDMVIVRIGPDPIGGIPDFDQLMEDESQSGTHEAIVAPILAGTTGD